MSDPTVAPAPVTSPRAEEPGGSPAQQAPIGEVKQEKPRGLLADAWLDLRRKPMFWIASVLIAFFIVVAAFPWLFTSVSPTVTGCGR